MRLNNKRTGLFYKYFFTNLLIFSIPVLLLGILIYQNAVSSLKNVIESTSIHSLNQVRNMTDARMNELKNISVRIAADPELSSYTIKRDGYHTSVAIRELGEYRDNSIIIDEIYLYYRGDDLIYSSAGSNALTTFSNYIYQFSDKDKERFIDNLVRVDTPTIKAYEDVVVNRTQTNRILTYLFPIPVNASYVNGSVMFLIKESMLNSLIEDILGDLKGNVYIFDANMNILVSKSEGAVVPIDPIREHLARVSSSGESIQYFELEKQEYSLMKVRSDVSNWTFVTVIPTAQFLGQVTHVQTIMVIGFVFILIVGLGTIIYFSFNQYRPIRELLEQLREVWTQSTQGDKSPNELESIRETITDVVQKHKGLLVQVDTHRPLIIEQFFTRLLKGNHKSKEEIEEFLLTQKLDIDARYYFVMYLPLCSSSDELVSVRRRTDMMQLLSVITMPGGIGYGVELIHEHSVVIITAMQVGQEELRQRQEEAAAYVLGLIRKDGHFSSTIGIGQVYEDLLEINRSFIEASAAAGYRLVSNKKDWIFFDEISDWQEKNVWYPIHEQVKLSQSLKQGDREVSLETLRTILKSIALKEQSLLLIKLICMDVINNVFKITNELHMDESLKNIKKLAQFTSLEELQVELEELVESICLEVERRKDEQSTSLRTNVSAYIQEHYASANISLEGMAEHFNLSVPYLSRLVKEQTGDTFTDYVGKLRLAFVKEQLRNTDLSVKDVILKAGYLDVSSFIRKFKGIEGITPGQYRKKQ